jgi:pantothenate kinase
LQEALAGDAAVVGMDGFHLAQCELDRLGRQTRKGAPDTFDPFGYAALLRRLRHNVEPVVYAPLFRRELEEPIGSCVPVARGVSLVITEGNYLLHDAAGWTSVREQIDEVWFLELPDGVRLERLTLRHQLYGRDPGAARAWATGSDQRNALIVQAGRDRADLIVKVVDE